MKRITGWFDDVESNTIIFWLVVGTLILVVIGAIATSREKDRFLAGCLQDHKEYECEERWSIAHPPTPITQGK